MSNWLFGQSNKLAWFDWNMNCQLIPALKDYYNKIEFSDNIVFGVELLFVSDNDPIASPLKHKKLTGQTLFGVINQVMQFLVAADIQDYQVFFINKEIPALVGTIEMTTDAALAGTIEMTTDAALTRLDTYLTDAESIFRQMCLVTAIIGFVFTVIKASRFVEQLSTTELLVQ